MSYCFFFMGVCVFLKRILSVEALFRVVCFSLSFKSLEKSNKQEKYGLCTKIGEGV